jgi:hypothetical protein
MRRRIFCEDYLAIRLCCSRSCWTLVDANSRTSCERNHATSRSPRTKGAALRLQRQRSYQSRKFSVTPPSTLGDARIGCESLRELLQGYMVQCIQEATWWHPEPPATCTRLRLCDLPPAIVSIYWVQRGSLLLRRRSFRCDRSPASRSGGRRETQVYFFDFLTKLRT